MGIISSQLNTYGKSSGSHKQAKVATLPIQKNEEKLKMEKHRLDML